MVEEEWEVGDEFIVIEDCSGEWLEIGNKGKVIGIDFFNGFIYFEKDKSIRTSRIQKINSQKTYELW
jgi:uncharacterized protein YuzE